MFLDNATMVAGNLRSPVSQRQMGVYENDGDRGHGERKMFQGNGRNGGERQIGHENWKNESEWQMFYSGCKNRGRLMCFHYGEMGHSNNGVMKLLATRTGGTL